MHVLVAYKLLLSVGAEVEDVASSRSFADGGSFLTLPMFYLEGARLVFVYLYLLCI